MFDSGALNLFFAYTGWRFYRNPTEKTAKHLFFYSLVYLPLLMTLFMLHKVRANLCHGCLCLID